MNKIFGLLFLIVISACQTPVTFDQPQPPNTIALRRIPKRLHGMYLSLDSTTTVIVEDKAIIKIFDYVNHLVVVFIVNFSNISYYVSFHFFFFVV